MKAILVDKVDDHYTVQLTDVAYGDLPAGDVTVEVEYSTLNYKDSLAITGASPVIRRFPMVPGIDFAGTVLESESREFAVGDGVVLNGWGVGETHWGGYAEQARVESEWLVPLPSVFTTRQAMAIGTAGFTAMLCVMTLEDAGVTPDKGTVLVTGASGGVGSVAVAILAKLGYTVAAVSAKPDADDFLRSLGASEILTREEMSAPPRALEGQRWAGAVDVVGTTTLARVLAEMNYGGCVAACGLAGGADLPTTVMPFILRNVSLRGVDSVMCPVERRKLAWQRLVNDLPAKALGEIGQVASLEQLPDLAEKITTGGVRGRVIVDLNA